MRVALCQLNPTVGDLEGNAAAIVDAAARAHAAGAVLAVFPELSVCGYPPRDLLDRPSFVREVRAQLESIAGRVPHDLALLVGFIDGEGAGTGGRVGPVGGVAFKPYNAAALLQGGAIRSVVHKRLLPTYDVFDEDRYFRPGDRPGLLQIAGRRVGVTICEDAWNDVDSPFRQAYAVNPIGECVEAGAELLINLSASPFTLAKRKARGSMLAAIAARHGVPLVFVNQVGGNDDLLFDGASAVYAANGWLVELSPTFTTDVRVVETDAEGVGAGDVRGITEQGSDVQGGAVLGGDVHSSDAAVALDALSMGVRDYAHKTGFRRAVLGLSGGIDSALVACIAARALGPSEVLGVAMPTRYSSQHSIEDAQQLAEALEIEFRVMPIEPMFETCAQTLTPWLDDLGPARQDTTFENLQARIRAITLMALSNRFDRLLLTTGNKSEISVGYCTLYGDMAGGLAVISDLPKTFVYEVAREVNRQAGRCLIPERTLIKAPSAELRPDQTDQDSLPPYDVLDAILERYVEDGQAADEIVQAGFEQATVQRVVRMIHASEYKRRQMPPGLIVTHKAFGPGRRYPIAQRYWR